MLDANICEVTNCNAPKRKNKGDRYDGLCVNCAHEMMCHDWEWKNFGKYEDPHIDW